MRYDEQVKLKLSEILPQGISRGVFRGRAYNHILPIEERAHEAQRAAILKYLGIDINPALLPENRYHKDIHHLNSSQLLCYNVFSRLINNSKTNEDMVKLFKKLHLSISLNQECKFEARDSLEWEEENEYEGTSFDFHIEGESEIFFEIKFTENGFGKAPKGPRHERKIRQLYIPLIRSCPLLSNDMSIEDVRDNYQLIRNVIRWRNNDTKIVFITDKRNLATENAIKYFKENFLIEPSGNVLFLTWQEIKNAWMSIDIEMPFQFICFEK